MKKLMNSSDRSRFCDPYAKATLIALAHFPDEGGLDTSKMALLKVAAHGETNEQPF